MNRMFIRTPGGVLETTAQKLTLLALIAGLGGSLLTVIGWTAHQADRIANSVPHSELYDSARAIRARLNEVNAIVLADHDLLVLTGARIKAMYCASIPERQRAGCN